MEAHDGRKLSHFFLRRGDEARRRNVGLVPLLVGACCVCMSSAGGGEGMSCLRVAASLWLANVGGEELRRREAVPFRVLSFACS